MSGCSHEQFQHKLWRVSSTEIEAEQKIEAEVEASAIAAEIKRQQEISVANLAKSEARKNTFLQFPADNDAVAPSRLSIGEIRNLELSPTITSPSVQVFSLTAAQEHIDFPKAAPLSQERGYVAPSRSPFSNGAIHVNQSVSIFPLDDTMISTLGGGSDQRHVRPHHQEPQFEDIQSPPPTERLVFKNIQTPVDFKPMTRHEFSNPSATVIYFAHDVMEISANEMSKVENIASAYQENPNATVNVLGHASLASDIQDPVKRQIANLKVSMGRAFAVSRALMKKGVPTKSIRTSGYGEGQQSAPHDGMDASAASRRVEVSVD